MDNNNLLYERIKYEQKKFHEQMRSIIIVLDFDGTVVEHAYPSIGKDLPYVVETLKKWTTELNVKIILSTMRSGQLLDDAVEWFKERQIPLYSIQEHPTQHEWTKSPKCHGDFCIDDRNVGTPLTIDSRGIPCIDWTKLKLIFEPLLTKMKQ